MVPTVSGRVLIIIVELHILLAFEMMVSSVVTFQALTSCSLGMRLYLLLGKHHLHSYCMSSD